ncbi:TonB-dependent receptor [Flavobacteriales bacterium]|nr:TonB-dependent receptor [Flavobacteriales bacterium]
MKTIKNILFGALLVSFGLTSMSQGTGEIKGLIWDYDENEPLPYATAKVSYAGNTIGDVSDFDGRFTIKPLQPGTYLLEVSFAGKEPKNITLEVKSGQIALRDTVFLSIGLMKEVKIFANTINPFEVNKPTVKGEKLKEMAVLRNSGALLESIAEGAITFNEGTGEVYFRGSRSNGIITYLDGMKITGSIPTYTAAAIKSYSVYTGGLPAKYGDTSGGVVEIETKTFFDLYNQRVAEMGITYE